MHVANMGLLLFMCRCEVLPKDVFHVDVQQMHPGTINGVFT